MASSDCPTAPSSASVCDVLSGRPGGIPKFIGHWLLRASLTMPGLYIAGVRDKRIITGALAGSTLISLFLLTYTAVERGRRGKAQGKLMTGRSTKPLRGAQNKLTAAQRAYVSAVEEDVHSNPDAYKPHVRANPAEWALQLIDNLDESEVKRLTREQRAETKLIARLTTTPKLRRRRV